MSRVTHREMWVNPKYKHLDATGLDKTQAGMLTLQSKNPVAPAPGSDKDGGRCMLHR